MEPLVAEKRFEGSGAQGPLRSRVVAITAGIAVLLAAIAGGVFWMRSRAPQPAPPPAAVQPQPSQAAPQAPAHPVESAEPALPADPHAADAALFDEMARLAGAPGLSKWIRPADLARHIVATVDALPRRQVPPAVLPTMPIPGSFLVAPASGGHVMAAANARRYLPWVHLLLSVDPSAAAGAYRHFLPLFERAYRELGYPGGDFNKRLVEAIDDALEAPQPALPPRLLQPSVMWVYEDQELETLSAGQKILLRIGPESGSAVRKWLQAFRARIA